MMGEGAITERAMEGGAMTEEGAIMGAMEGGAMTGGAMTGRDCPWESWRGEGAMTGRGYDGERAVQEVLAWRGGAMTGRGYDGRGYGGGWNHLGGAVRSRQGPSRSGIGGPRKGGSQGEAGAKGEGGI